LGERCCVDRVRLFPVYSQCPAIPEQIGVSII
jgi:hypothetical protein